jgi:hypothetical protein
MVETMRSRNWGGAVAGAWLFVALWFVFPPVLAWAQSPGDANCDGLLSVADYSFAALQLFQPPPWACPALDANGDGVVSAADLPALASLISAPPPTGPEITFFGLAAADGTPLNRSGTLAGAVVYQRPAGQGFKLVIEARPGASGVSVGQTVFASDPRDPTVRPDLWIVASQPLGDGSPTVCEGGVPGVTRPDFAFTRSVTDAINDLACNFVVATAPAFACTSDRFGRPAFVTDSAQVQFCVQVTRQLIFPDGETLVSVRVRDRAGNLGPLAQIRLRVGPGPFGPTATATPSATSTGARLSPTRTPTPSASPTRSASASPTRTWTAPFTRSPTASSTPQFSPTATRTPSVSTPAPTHTFTLATPSPSATRAEPSVLPTASPTRTMTRTVSPTPPTQQPTPSPTRSSTASPTLSPTRSATATPPRTRTPTRTPTAPPGPVVRYFGLTRSDDVPIDPIGTTPEGIPIFSRPQGFGFNIVVEAARGPSNNQVGADTFVPDLSGPPDLQIIASRPLGDGSDAVCDSTGPNAGGVPGLQPPSFLPTESVIRILNDFGCRFVDGSGAPRGRGTQEACTRVPPEMDFRFVAPDSSLQFCASVTRAIEFPPGDTLLTVRVLDETSPDAPPGSGLPGPTARIIVRIGDANTPTATVTPSPTRTPTSAATATSTQANSSRTPTRSPTGQSGTVTPSRTATRSPTASRTPSATPTPSGVDRAPIVTFFGVARADGTLVEPTEFTPAGVPVYARPLGAGFTVVVEAKPGPSGSAVGISTYQSDLADLPDLQVVASRALGNGSSDVCDYRLPAAGGVPGVDPPRFDDVNVVNDLACRFRDGTDEPRGRALADACVLFDNGAFGFVRPDSSVQFCALVDRAWQFPPGETLLSVRVRDSAGNLSAVSQIIVRVEG